jgi:RNA polymerase sigma-70 factor (ECF subfamily)
MVRRDDASLARAAARGDTEAFAALVSRHQDRLYGVIHRMVGDSERAMDLVQETFLRAWRGLPGYTGAAVFSTWIYRIARNVVVSALRAEAARPRLVPESSLAGPGGEAPVQERAPLSESPDAALLKVEDRERLVRALLSMPSDFREVLILRDIEDRPYESIADLLEIPLGTVRSRLFRARLELRERLRILLGVSP